jgi:hypothetical protein
MQPLWTTTNTVQTEILGRGTAIEPDLFAALACRHHRCNAIPARPITHGWAAGLRSDLSRRQPPSRSVTTAYEPGFACRQYVGPLIANQYLTSGMPQSIPGDSGGPVWQPSRDGSATTVGIWLGQHVDQDGAFGRLTSLTDVLPTISTQAKTRIL